MNKDAVTKYQMSPTRLGFYTIIFWLALLAPIPAAGLTVCGPALQLKYHPFCRS